MLNSIGGRLSRSHQPIAVLGTENVGQGFKQFEKVHINHARGCA